MLERKVVLNKIVVWVYDACRACGRIHSWLPKPKILDENK